MNREKAPDSPKKSYRNTRQKRSNTSNYAAQRKLLKAYVTKIKQESKCQICGESDIACLDFHHVGSKYDNISDMVRHAVPLKVLKKELAKCIVVCANCHRKIHYYGEK